MNIFRLSYRNIISRPLSTTLTLVLLTLGVGMISLLIQVNGQIQEQMRNNIRGIDMVVGAKGSPMQLILSAVYHVDVPTGNIALSEVNKLKKNRMIAKTIPLSYGDNFEGYRIVGTEEAYLDHYQAEIVEGRIWNKPFEVTLGASVAALKNLKVGDTFSGSHGLTQGGQSHDEHAYEVVGILAYSNSVLDQLVLTATESVWDVHNHQHSDEKAQHKEEEHEHAHDEAEHEHHHDHNDGEEHLHHEDEHHEHEEDAHHHQHEDSEEPHEHEMEKEEDKEITALLVKFRSPAALVQVPRMVNETTNMQAAVPAFEVSRLFGLMGIGLEGLRAIALVIMIVAGLSVFISLYNALNERQYEMALMRTYGASKVQVVWMVLQEGLLLSIFGFLFGMLFSRIGLWIIANYMKSDYHYQFQGFTFTTEEVWLFGISIFIGLFASLLPAIRAFRINISNTLADA